MEVDLYLLKNIDFTNTDTLIFLSIVFIVALIISSALVIVVSKIIRKVKRIIFGVLGVDAKKPKFNQKNTDWLHKDDPLKNIEIPVKNITGPAPMGAVNAGAKKSVNNLGYKKAEITPANPKAANSATTEGLDLGTSIQELKNGKESPGNSVSKNTDSSIMFKGRPEVSKMKLEYEMKSDPNLWKASKQVGLTLNREERAKLIKETFSSAYGRNISKSDLRWGIKKLNQKMLSAKDPAEHAKIRKEINFFKKIGGIH